MNGSPQVDAYTNTYRNFASDVWAEIRRATYDEDIGQNSWLGARELRVFLEWLDVSASSSVLEVACGSGGPACHIVQTTGCYLTGIDNSAEGITAAKTLAQRLGLADRASFHQADANESLPFDDSAFDAVICIDAINHLRDRPAVLMEWNRVLRRGGAVVFTDPVVVTGAVTNAEFAQRSSIGFFLFVPPGHNERLLAEAGFTFVRAQDATEAAADVSARRRAARERFRDELVALEGQEQFEGLQTFLQSVHQLSASRRLSRLVYHAVKPTT